MPRPSALEQTDADIIPKMKKPADKNKPSPSAIDYPTPVIDEEGFRQYSETEILEYIIRSLQGYMRPEEKEFVEQKARFPMDILQQDPYGFFLTTSQISAYICIWRKEKNGHTDDV